VGEWEQSRRRGLRGVKTRGEEWRGEEEEKKLKK